ncbi:MAG: hypothetical protein JW889_09825 [Verrucomicrobia bacterium]|nr:hypothetical protein [Verrucomicrobiota bacterium]
MPPQNAQPATEEDPEPAFGKENDAQTIQFLHEKRYAFFKTRQEHEWKVYFAAWVLLGALDAAVLTGKLPLSGWPIFVFWIPSCLLVFGVVWGYQANLQHANKEDRKALNTLYNRLCGLVGVPKESPVRARTWPYRRWYRFGWAFPWQVLLLLMAVAVSACLPFFHRASLDRGETDSATKPPDRVETQVSAPDQTNTAPH